MLSMLGNAANCSTSLISKSSSVKLSSAPSSKSATVNSKETGTIPASRILKPLWRLTCRSSPVLLNDKALQHSRVFAIHDCPQRPYKFGFTQSYGKSYGGIVPVFIEFTGQP